VTDNLVLVVHGWNSNSAAWPNQLVDAICAKLSISPSLPGITNTNSSGMDHQCQDTHWGVYAYNWASDAATGLDPFTALANAQDLGDQWAKVLWALAQHAGKSWKVVHLVGHSAGAGFVQEFAKTIKKLSNQNQPAPKIIATFLDAFCPDPDSCEYGVAPASDPPAADLAEHYVDTRNVLPSWASHPLGDFNGNTLGLTNIILPNAFNFDITALDNNGASNYGSLYPVDFHAFPYRYYLKTAGVQPPGTFSAYTLDSLAFGAKWAPWSQPGAQAGDVWSATLANYVGFSVGDRCVTSRTLDLGLGSCNPSFSRRWFHLPATIASQSLQSLGCLGVLLNGVVSVGTCVPSGSPAGMSSPSAVSPDPGMALLRINLTQPANRIRFDYRFTQTGSGGGVQVFIQDDKMIFVTLQITGDIGTHTTDWIDIPALTAGDQNLRVVVKPMGGDNAGVEVSNMQFSYASLDDFPIGGNIPVGWIQPAGSNAPWMVTGDAAYTGTLSLKSGLISQNQQSDLSITDNFPAGDVSFARKVSSELNYDYLQFYVDGVFKGAWSGEVDWSVVSFPLGGGTHTLLWRYMKNGSVSSGSDAAWIDSVSLPGSVTNYTLTAAKAGTGSGTVTSNLAGINCGATCSASYVSGSSVTLTAIPARGSIFTGWSGACSGTGSCVVNMSAAQSVVATFTSAVTPMVAAGGDHAIVLKSDGTLMAWGRNVQGQLGDGTATNRSSPVAVPGVAGVVAVAAGGFHTVALKSDGTVMAWGYNDSGQLGDGTLTNRPSPVVVPGLTGVVAVAAGERHTVVLKSDGTLMAWGNNNNGQLGDGTTTQRLSPVTVPGLNGVVAVAASGDITAVLKADGTMDIVVAAAPMLPALTGLTGVASMAIGYNHAVALRLDGTVIVLGDNNYGQLGIGTVDGSSSWVPVPGLAGVVAVTAGYYQTLALKSDGTVMAWGRNDYGQLGDGSTTQRLSPVAMPGLTGVVAVSEGAYWGVALKVDGTLVGWGYNGYGELGDGSLTTRLSPVAVTGGLNLGSITATIGTSPTSLTFASQNVGTSSASQTLNLTYTGGSPLSSLSINTVGDFAANTSCGNSVSAGTSCTVNVTFAPSARGTRSGAVSIAVDRVIVNSVSLSGTGFLPASLANIATRGGVQTGDNVMIAGFIIGGSTPKTVLIRARGPSMAAQGVPGLLANPVLNLYSGSTVIASNDNWGSASNWDAIQATGMAPTNALEAAIMVTLSPGPYTAIVTGNGGATGIAIVEVLEIDNLVSPLVNIATRGLVQTGDGVMIAGFIIYGSTPQTVLIRARGPSMAAYGVPNLLADPFLQLYSGSTVIGSNDNWGTASNASGILATGLQPTDSRESAILITLNPGPYTAIVTGAGGTTGVAIVEVLAQ
jgi:alpha-tubulin suppressor-like RCC1 family protein